jgi:hypothetical protein
VYGLSLNDDETWPNQLERKLNESGQGRFEVWNGGACAYVPSQMVIVAREAVEKYRPDLVVLGLSNGGSRVFMSEAPIRPYFMRHKEMWEELFTPDCAAGPNFVPYAARLWFVRHIRSYRLLTAAGAERKKECTWYENLRHEADNVRDMRDFVAWAEGRTKTMIFLCPETQNHAFDYIPYFKDLRVPVMQLSAEGLPQEYWDIHPPATVTPWYAEKIAAWLRGLGLVPTED